MKRLPKVMVLDDDTDWLSQVPLILEDDCEVCGYPTIDQGIEALSQGYFDIVLLDINFKGDERSGLDVFRLIQAADRGADVIVISGETNPSRIIQIVNSGVTKFLVKPVPPDEVRAAVLTTLEQRAARERAHSLRASEKQGFALVGQSIPMQKLRREIAEVVASGVKDILLLGETGTGKEVVAQSIAYEADASRRLIPIHCGAISDGIAESELFGHVKGAFTGADRDRSSAFEDAKGGFVFMDEIGDMPLAQQAKLLRVLQERRVQRVGSHKEIDVNFRSISATNVDIEDSVRKKRFREDLFYRIAKAKIKIPALRDRVEDISELVQHFIVAVGDKRQISITVDAVDLLKAYHWPGNVRQLKALVESLCARSKDGIIRDADICRALPEVAAMFGNRTTRGLVGRYGTAIILKERERFIQALREASGDRDQAAYILGLSRATYFRRAKELGLVNNAKDRQLRIVPSSL
jgi:DNA-binding NtrC family response regulator